MKKKIMAIVLVTGLAAATAASANWGRGGNGGACGAYYQNAPYGMMAQQPVPQLDAATQEKLDKFFTDTTEMRKEIAVKQAEKMALMRGDNPDAAMVAKLTGELFDLRNAMHAKAVEAGVDQYLGPRGGMGMMMGQGGGMKGKGGMRGQGRF